MRSHRDDAMPRCSDDPTPEPLGCVVALVFGIVVFLTVWASVACVFLVGNAVGW